VTSEVLLEISGEDSLTEIREVSFREYGLEKIPELLQELTSLEVCCYSSCFVLTRQLNVSSDVFSLHSC
jgi:hypothetical protein